MGAGDELSAVDGLTSVWGGGQLLAFSAVDGQTDYHHGLTARTSFQNCGLEIMAPGTCRLDFGLQRPQRTVLSNDFLILRDPSISLRVAFLDTHHLLITGPCTIGNCAGDIRVVQREDKTLVGSAQFMNAGLINADLDEALAKRSRWLRALLRLEAFSPLRRNALWKALSIMKSQVYSPQGQIRHRWTTPDRWPHKDMWLWDSAFHAVGWRHVDASLAKEMLSAVLDTQKDNGFIAHSSNPDASTRITQPPVLALAAELVLQAQDDPDWLAEIYPRLAAYVRWDLAHRDNDGAGLAEWFIEDTPTCRSGESGMDNSPRFDRAGRLDAVDFNSYLARECQTLGRFARRLGLEEESHHWASLHARLCDGINRRCWDEDAGFYFDYDLDRQERSNVAASSGFLPMLCGAASAPQIRRLTLQLRDATMFGTPVPVPSIAVRDTAHYAKDMWRGPMWVNVNWMIIRGLLESGYHGLAGELTEKTLAEIERCYARYGTFFEFYDDRREIDPPCLERKGRCDPTNPYHQVVHDYGWTAALYVDLVLQSEGPPCNGAKARA